MSSDFRTLALDHFISPLFAVTAEGKFARDSQKAWDDDLRTTIDLKGEAIVGGPAAIALDDAYVTKGPA